MAKIKKNTTGIGLSNLVPDLVASYNKLEKKLSQPCSDMITDCIISDVPMKCSRLFQPFTTDLGHCCSFNLMPSLLGWDKNIFTNDDGKQSY